MSITRNDQGDKRSLTRQLIEKSELRAVGIIAKHVHIVVGLLSDPDPGKVLGDFKSDASCVTMQRCLRRLNM